MKKLLLIVLVCIGIGLWYSSLQKPTPPVAQTESPAPTTAEATQSGTTQVFGVDQFIQASPDNAYLKAGGSSYSDPQGVFGFLYPNEYVIDHNDGDVYTRISKKGATQKGQTEMYDGIIVVFQRVDLKGKTLSEWVDDQIQLSSTGGSEITQPKKDVTLNDYSGFTYEVRSLGTSSYLVLRKDPNSEFAVSITSLVADPQQKGYQSEVDAILSTLDIKK